MAGQGPDAAWGPSCAELFCFLSQKNSSVWPACGLDVAEGLWEQATGSDALGAGLRADAGTWLGKASMLGRRIFLFSSQGTSRVWPACGLDAAEALQCAH